VLHDLWSDFDPGASGEFLFCLAGRHGDHARSTLSSNAKLVWTVEATSHFEAMTMYYEHQGWGTYTSDQEWDRKTYAEHGWE
jgi:hypothetical protein